MKTQVSAASSVGFEVIMSRRRTHLRSLRVRELEPGNKDAEKELRALAGPLKELAAKEKQRCAESGDMCIFAFCFALACE